jgi:hypothetical protein
VAALSQSCPFLEGGTACQSTWTPQHARYTELESVALLHQTDALSLSLYLGLQFGLILASTPWRLVPLWTVLHWQRRSYWYLVRLAPLDGCLCLSLTIRRSSLSRTEFEECIRQGFSGSRPPRP